MADAENLEFFSVMQPAARRGALRRARPLCAARGQTLLDRGDASSDIFFVLEGSLQVLLYSSNGREVSLRELCGGDVFGEMSAIDGESRSASIVSLADSRLLAMSRGDFLDVIAGSPEAALWLMRQLSARIRGLTERVFELSALNVQARLHCELLRLAARSPTGREIDPAPTHSELASRIGTHREAVTREMRSLVVKNIIKTGRRRMEFIDLSRLQTFAAAQPTPVPQDDAPG
jgi:CRP-like cAMP-binding protein